MGRACLAQKRKKKKKKHQTVFQSDCTILHGTKNFRFDKVNVEKQSFISYMRNSKIILLNTRTTEEAKNPR